MLAGGEGTRLRPLTYTVPKAVMPLAGRPFLSYMLDWLRAHGVDDVVMSCGFLSAEVRLVLGDIYQGMRLRYVVEDEPLGTAGPVRLAHDQGILEDRVVIANGDGRFRLASATADRIRTLGYIIDLGDTPTLVDATIIYYRPGFDDEAVYAATDIGVYQTLDAGATWTSYSNGLPNAIVGDLILHQATRSLRCGTRSRGAWQVPI